MPQPTSRIPRKFVLTLSTLVIVFVPLTGYLMFEFPARGPGMTPAELIAALGMGAILAFAIGGTIWYQWKAVRGQTVPPAVSASTEGKLERVAGLLGAVIYSVISVSTLIILAFAFTVRDKLLPGEFWIFLAIGIVVAAATGFVARLKWRARAGYLMAASEEPHTNADDMPFTQYRFERVLIGCTAIGLIVLGLVAFGLLLFGGDVAVGHYMSPPLLYLEWLVAGLIAFPFVKRLIA